MSKEESQAKEVSSDEIKSTADGTTAAPVAVRKKIKKSIPVGIFHVKATFNNTIITLTDTNGNVLSWSSAGSKGFKGSKKSTPFAAQVSAEDVVLKARDYGLKTASVLMNGPGAGRESALRAIAGSGVRITLIKDVTPIPHNGCRPPKRRRV